MNNVSKKDIQEVKALANPPQGVKDVFTAVAIIQKGVEPTWADIKKEMANPDNYIANLQSSF